MFGFTKSTTRLKRKWDRILGTGIGILRKKETQKKKKRSVPGPKRTILGEPETDSARAESLPTGEGEGPAALAKTLLQRLTFVSIYWRMVGGGANPAAPRYPLGRSRLSTKGSSKCFYVTDSI